MHSDRRKRIGSEMLTHLDEKKIILISQDPYPKL
jgi:uracil DNA glycosylase